MKVVTTFNHRLIVDSFLQSDSALGSSHENGVQGCGIISGFESYVQIRLPGERHQRWINRVRLSPSFVAQE
jgi:hypothetical protein